MADIFIEPSESKARPARRKTKKEMSDEEYIKVCEKMAKLREARKATPDKPKPAKPVKEKEVIKYVDRPVEVVKEVIKEVVKEVPAKPRASPVDLFGDTDDLKAELKEVKGILADMARAKREKQEAKQLAKDNKPEAVLKPVGRHHILSLYQLLPG